MRERKRFSGAGQTSRRSVPIAAYVGPNGGGKSLAMVHDTLPSLAAGRAVLSTVKLLDYEAADGSLHPSYTRLSSWRQLMDIEHCDVLLDEVTGVASSRASASLPAELQNLFVQLRRRDVVLRYTTPNWARTEVILREVTQSVTVCKGFMYQKVEGSLWPQKRLFRWATYDAIDWEDMSLAKVKAAKPLCKAWYWRPEKAAMLAYNTLDAVSSLDHVSETGLCIECGGQRARKKCGCVSHDRPAGAGEARQGRTGAAELRGLTG